MGTLEVVIPPDILNDNESSDGGVAVEGGTVTLQCHATGVPAPEVRWKREDSRNIVLRHDGREKQGKHVIHNMDWYHIDNISNSCITCS